MYGKRRGIVECVFAEHINPGSLKELLLKIQTELPHHLRLPADTTEELWKYYKALICITLLEDNKRLALMALPLLGRGISFEVYQVMNLPEQNRDQRWRQSVKEMIIVDNRKKRKCEPVALGILLHSVRSM